MRGTGSGLGLHRNVVSVGVGVGEGDLSRCLQTTLSGKLDNVVITPHIGYVTEDGLRAAWQRMAQDVAAYFAGSPIRVVADPADLPPMAPQ